MAENTSRYPQLNMPPCDLTINGEEVWDIVRRRWVALTPEEWVRQHVVSTLSRHMGYPLELMQVEGSISLNGLSRRCDVVVYGRDARPRMIVECKQPAVQLTQQVIDQACRYNTVLQVPYLYLTNGMQHLVLKVDVLHQCLQRVEKMPSWDELKL